MTRNCQASPVTSQNESHRRLHCQIEGGVKTEIVEWFALDDHRIGGLARVPHFMAQSGPNHRNGQVETADSPCQFGDVQ